MMTNASTDASLPTQSGILEQWQSVLESDNGEQAKSLLLLADDDGRLLQDALFHTPLPTNVINACAEHGCMAGDWIQHALNKGNVSGYARDWGAILAWHSEKFGLERTRDRVVKCLDSACRTWIKKNSRAFLRAALNQDPALVHDLLASDRASQLMLLAIAHPEDSWPERSPVSIVSLLERAQFMNGLATSASFHPNGTALDQWLDHMPSRREAWNRAGVRDEDNERLLTTWLDQWVPNRTWARSPLAAWCNEVKEGRAPKKDPTQHPAFGGRVWLPSARKKEHIARHFGTSEGLNGYNLETGLRSAINGLIRAKEAVRNASPLFCHLHTPFQVRHLALTLGDTPTWEALSSTEGARWLQETLQQGGRAVSLLERHNMAELVSWMVRDETWREWKTDRGMTLFDVGLDLFAGFGPDTDKKRLNQQMALKLDRLCPGLLTTPDALGQIPLDLLGVKPATRSAVLRQALKREAKVGKRPKAPHSQRM